MVLFCVKMFRHVSGDHYAAHRFSGAGRGYVGHRQGHACQDPSRHPAGTGAAERRCTQSPDTGARRGGDRRHPRRDRCRYQRGPTGPYGSGGADHRTGHDPRPGGGPALWPPYRRHRLSVDDHGHRMPGADPRYRLAMLPHPQRIQGRGKRDQGPQGGGGGDHRRCHRHAGKPASTIVPS